MPVRNLPGRRPPDIHLAGDVVEEAPQHRDPGCPARHPGMHRDHEEAAGLDNRVERPGPVFKKPVRSGRRPCVPRIPEIPIEDRVIHTPVDRNLNDIPDPVRMLETHQGAVIRDPGVFQERNLQAGPQLPAGERIVVDIPWWTPWSYFVPRSIPSITPPGT